MTREDWGSVVVLYWIVAYAWLASLAIRNIAIDAHRQRRAKPWDNHGERLYG